MADAVESAKAAMFPEVKSPGDELPAEVLKASQGKTWSEILTTVSDKPPVWEKAELTGSPEHSGARARVVVMGEAGWVLFEVANDGSGATAIQVGDDERIDSKDPEEIALGFAGLYSIKSGSADGKALLKKSHARAIQSKNLMILSGISRSGRAWALDNDGLYPEDLDTLVKSGGLTADRLQVTNPTTNESEAPVYFPGFNDASPAKFMLLACPFTNPDGTRSVAFLDGSVKNIPEATYQATVKIQ